MFKKRESTAMYSTSYMFILMLTLPLGVLCYGSCPSGCQCSHTRPLTVFCIGNSFNDTTEKIPPETVKYQYEAHEDEVNLGATDFSHLVSLEVLHLSSPFDHMVLTRSITLITQNQQRVFWPLKMLKELRININWGLEIALPDLFKASTNLETLDLSNTRKLNYTNLKETLVGLENSTVFKSLNIHSSQTMEQLTNGLTLNLTDLLDPLKNCPLEDFDLSYNALRTVVPGLLSKAPRLKKLDASNNFITSLITSAFFLEVVIHPSLIEADFSEQGLGIPQRNSINESSSFQTPMLTEVPPVQLVRQSDGKYQRDILNHPVYHSNKNCFGGLFQDLCNIFQPECANFLQSITENHQIFCNILTLFIPYIMFIPCEFLPLASSFLNRDCGGCFVVPVTGNVRRVHLQYINNYDQVLAAPVFLDKTCFNTKNSLEVLDFSHNREHGYIDVDLVVSTTFLGFHNMTVFNLSFNQVQHLSPDWGSNLPQIEVFDLSYNLLDLQGQYGDFLAGATSLLELNLAGNIVQQIPYGRFTTLSHLQTLNMSNNVLQSFTVDIRNLTELSTIDLSGNEIPSLAPGMISQLSAQALHLKNKTGMPLTIDLSRNALLCTCSVKHFTEWVLSEPENIVFVNFDKYTCLNDASSQENFHRLKKRGIFECLSTNVYVGVGVGSGILLSGIIAAVVNLIYRKRWWIRYHYFIARRMLIHIRKKEEQNTDYRWDAFVSYNSRDNDWVEEVLQPKLEDENGIRLCLHERDFQYGGIITDLIVESIENSRKTILILSPHFVQSNWCKLEMHMAHQRLFSAGHDALLLVILKPLVNVEISKTLKALLEQKNYVEWTENEYGQKLFWAKLIGALNVPKKTTEGIRRDEEDANAGNVADDDEERLIYPSTSAEQF